MSHWFVEYTDTFGGEANYCWVRRYYLKTDNDKVPVRQAKKLCGLTGARGCSNEHGDEYEFRPYRSCTVMFISWIGQSEYEDATKDN